MPLIALLSPNFNIVICLILSDFMRNNPNLRWQAQIFLVCIFLPLKYTPLFNRVSISELSVYLSGSNDSNINLRPGVDKVKPKVWFKLTIRNSARLFPQFLFNMGDMHLVLPTLNLS